jgi:mannose-6-phosphate isomerase
MGMLTRLQTKVVDKPWGVVGIDPRFGADPARQVGEIWFEAPKGRSLDVMAKYLFTSERLSVQVHPDDALARAMGLPSGKDECWIILDAAADGELGIGTTRPVAPDDLIAAAKDGSIVDLIDWRHPSEGDFVFNPARTVHALGAGLTLLEIQQSADVTLRLYDYGRDRPLHLEESRNVVDARPHHSNLDCAIDRSQSSILVDQGHFGVAWCHGVAPELPRVRDLQLLPIDAAMEVDGEALRPGECALFDGDPLSLRSDGNFVLAWSRTGA